MRWSLGRNAFWLRLKGEAYRIFSCTFVSARIFQSWGALPVISLTLSPCIRKCLQKLELETMEGLLRYARKKGLDSLLKIPGFGPLGLDQLKFQLEKHKIINKAGDSDLYQYIINELDSITQKEPLFTGRPFLCDAGNNQ